MPYKGKAQKRAKDREYNKTYRSRHKDFIRERYKELNKRVRRSRFEENRNYVMNHLLEHPCVDCGESDICVLEFDHVRGEKLDNVSAGISRRWPIEKLQTEIDKCEVRCANCHRRVTQIRRGSCYLSTQP